MTVSAEEKKLMGEAFQRVWDGIMKSDATTHLEWLSKQPTALVRSTALTTQPPGWGVLAKPFIDSLTDEQAAMFLAALVAVFVQAQPPAPPK